MSLSKNWPISESEYVLSETALHEFIDAANSCRPISYFATTAIEAHNTAVFALVDLRIAAEKYYEAAGFRE